MKSAEDYIVKTPKKRQLSYNSLTVNFPINKKIKIHYKLLLKDFLMSKVVLLKNIEYYGNHTSFCMTPNSYPF